MDNFQFMNPTKILFGKGQLANLDQEIPKGAKVLILYGGGSAKRTGLLDTVKQALKGHSFGEFGGIEPNPTYETLMQAVALVRKDKYDFLLAVGGGSVIDGTKFVAAAVPFTQGEPWGLLAQHLPVKTALPFGTVLTLPATGSEMNSGAVITRREFRAKLAFMSPALYPKFSILDPVLTYTLPARQVANGEVDAYVHVMEQYLTYPVGAKVQDRFAEGLLLTLIEEGPKALQDGQNYEVRANLMWAATLALNGLIGTGVPQDWATHMLGHEITALHGLDHGQTLAIVLPSMLEAMKADKRAKLLQYAQRVWGIQSGTDEERISLAIAKTRGFFEALGVATHLSAYKVGANAVEPLVASLESHGMTTLGESGKVTPQVSRRVLQASL
jgi:NADP-dependent alcohol dehydrogenase